MSAVMPREALVAPAKPFPPRIGEADVAPAIVAPAIVAPVAADAPPAAPRIRAEMRLLALGLAEGRIKLAGVYARWILRAGPQQAPERAAVLRAIVAGCIRRPAGDAHDLLAMADEAMEWVRAE